MVRHGHVRGLVGGSAPHTPGRADRAHDVRNRRRESWRRRLCRPEMARDGPGGRGQARTRSARTRPRSTAAPQSLESSRPHFGVVVAGRVLATPVSAAGTRSPSTHEERSGTESAYRGCGVRFALAAPTEAVPTARARSASRLVVVAVAGVEPGVARARPHARGVQRRSARLRASRPPRTRAARPPRASAGWDRAAMLGYNYPDSKWYRNSFALLQKHGSKPQAHEGSWITKNWNGDGKPT